MDNLISRQSAISAVGFAIADSISITREDWNAIIEALEALPSAQPELVEKVAYIRGFEQGRTQGMIDTKAEEVAQPTCNQLATDTIRRQAAINAVTDELDMIDHVPQWVFDRLEKRLKQRILDDVPSAQSESCEYYALCRHGRDESKLRVRLGFCEYCHEDSDGYVRSIEKNSHAWLVRRGRTMKLRVGFKGEYRECDILFCPMCGRRLTDG